MRSATAVLDSFPFGGGVTSLQTFAMGAALVTLPSTFLSGRLTFSMYKELGLAPDLRCCVAANITHYVDISLRLARDPAHRRQVRSQILERSHRLFESKEALEEWGRFLQMLSASIYT
jgi:protein O-GlcNAc transferase